MLEEVDMRMNESKKDTRDFKRDVIVGAENPRTGRTMSDKFIKCGTTACSILRRSSVVVMSCDF